MKTHVLTAVACLALTALPAVAAPIVFNTTGAIVNYTVPVSGQYTITAVGAKGGDGVPNSGFVGGGAGTGGLGAEAGGTFALTQGEMLQILVGAAGTADPVGIAGGGGGSFIVGPGGLPLVVAGGGGGGGLYPVGFAGVAYGFNGGDALTGPDGGPTSVPGFQTGFGTDGMGGTGGGNGQGGIFQIVGIQSKINFGRGFNAFASGLGGGAFGGGGSTVDPVTSAPGGGGGGGYSGGGGGGETFPGSFKYPVGYAGGGGGGSYTAGNDPFLLARIGTGDGFVTITPDAVAVPEPGALALFGMGLFGLCAVRQARRR